MIMIATSKCVDLEVNLDTVPRSNNDIFIFISSSFNNTLINIYSTKRA